MRIGIFGGTFDPIHNAHIAAVRAVKEALRLDLVLFVPAARPRLRSREPRASVEHRLAMVRLALADLAWAEVSTVDIARPGPAYSVDTVAAIRCQYGPDAQLYLLVGADALESLPRWKGPQKLLANAKLVCVGRPGSARPDSLPPAHPGRRAIFVQGPMIAVSATEIRERIASGRAIRDWLQPGVVSYIEKHGLYRR